MGAHRVTSSEAIRAAGFELLSANPGVSLAEIADRAGVGAATLHRHFASRAELLRVLADEGIAALAAVIDATEREPSASAALDTLLAELIPLGARYAFLERCPFEPEVEARYAVVARRLEALMERLAEEGVLATDLSPARAADFLEWVVWGTCEGVSDERLAPRDAVGLARRLFLGGAGAH